MRISQRYGPIVHMKMGAQNIILLNDPDIVKTLFSMKTFHDRPMLRSYRPFPAFAGINGDDWSLRRKLLRSVMSTNLNHQFVEENIMNTLSVQTFPTLERLSNSRDPWILQNDIFYILFKLFFEATFGSSIDFHDPTVSKCQHIFRTIFSISIKSRFISYIPLLKNFIGNDVTATQRCARQREEIFAELVSEFKGSQVKTSILGDLLSGRRLSIKDLTADIGVIFSAGTDITSSTLEYTLLLTAKYPDIQERVRSELQNQAATSTGFLSLSTLRNCPLFRAFIHEALRIATPGVLGVAHSPSQDVSINIEGNNYIIPKSSIVYANITYIQEASLGKWKNIDTLCLENWLDSNRKFKLHNSFLAFGHGKRNCIAEYLAKSIIMFTVGNLLYRYKFQFATNVVDIRKHFCLTLSIDHDLHLHVSKR